MIIVERTIDRKQGWRFMRTAPACDYCRVTGPWNYHDSETDGAATARYQVPRAWAQRIVAAVARYVCGTCLAAEEAGAVLVPGRKPVPPLGQIPLFSHREVAGG